LVKLLYFAWVRQKIGKTEEEYSLPGGVSNVRELIEALAARGPGYAAAFRNADSIRCAVNQEHKTFDTAIKDTDEIAFFPPVTGG
jgi:molybdopterin synthase sulfur carrier subunit